MAACTVVAAVASGITVSATAGAPAVSAPARVGSATSLGERSRGSPRLLGRSAAGRPIRVIESGKAGGARTVLVFGCIHGSECAGMAVARRLAATRPPAGARLVTVPNLNPDGYAAGTRQNGRGVDLNRNFPRGWRALGAPGALHYSGPRPLSEPESQLARRLIIRLRPRVTIWFHQALALVDRSGGDVAIERRYARLTGLPLRRLPPYPGTATRWQNHAFAGTTSFVVELPAGPLSANATRRHAAAIIRLAAATR